MTSCVVECLGEKCIKEKDVYHVILQRSGLDLNSVIYIVCFLKIKRAWVAQ